MGKTGYTCIRRTFCSLNVLVWICGSCFFGLGLWLRLSYEGYATLLPDNAGLSADYILMTFGVLSLVISFFGCCGSWLQSRCCLIIYFSLVIVLFLSEFLLGSVAFVFRGGIARMIANEMKYGIEKHYNASDRGSLIAPSVAVIYDQMQTELQCCGIQSYEDWYDISSWPGERWVPRSCCKPKLFDNSQDGSGDGGFLDCRKSKDPSLWWEHGCARALQMFFIERLHIVGSIGLGIAFFQLFGLIASMLLFLHNQAHAKVRNVQIVFAPGGQQPESEQQSDVIVSGRLAIVEQPMAASHQASVAGGFLHIQFSFNDNAETSSHN